MTFLKEKKPEILAQAVFGFAVGHEIEPGPNTIYHLFIALGFSSAIFLDDYSAIKAVVDVAISEEAEIIRIGKEFISQAMPEGEIKRPDLLERIETARNKQLEKFVNTLTFIQSMNE